MRPTTTRCNQPVRLLLICATVFAVTACSGKKNHEKPEAVAVEETGPTANEHFTKANIQLDEQQWEAAIAAYDEAISVDPQMWESHMNRGIALSRLAKFAEALSAFEDALRAGGDQQMVVYFNLGNLYQDRGMYSAAIDAYRAALAFEGDKIDTLVNLGAAYVFLRQYDLATETFQHTRGLAPMDPRPVHGIALIHQMEEKYNEAVDLFAEAQRLDPNFPLAYFSQAQCYSALKRYDEAIAAIDRFMQVFPESRHIRRAEAMKATYIKRKQGK